MGSWSGFGMGGYDGGEFVLIAPNNLQYSALNGEVTVTWDAVPGATGYEYSPDDATWEAVSGPSEAHTFTGGPSASGTAYVRAVGGPSGSVAWMTDAAPNVPTAVEYTGTALEWDSPSSGPLVLAYIVYLEGVQQDVTDGSTFTYTLAAAAGQSVGVAAVSSGGQSSTVNVVRPTAAITDNSSAPIYRPVTITFSSASTTGDFTAGDSVWDYRLNSGAWTGLGTGATVDLTPAAAGTYDVQLTVSGPGGPGSTISSGFVVYNEPAITDPGSVTPSSGETGVTSFSVGGTTWTGGAGSGTLTIDWGEGGGFEINNLHTYATAGTYPVSVKVTDDNGHTDTESLGSVEVSDP